MYKPQLVLPIYETLESGSLLDSTAIEAALGDEAVSRISTELKATGEVMVIGSTALVATINAIPFDNNHTRVRGTAADTDLYTSGIEVLSSDTHTLSELTRYRRQALQDLRAEGLRIPAQVAHTIDNLSGNSTLTLSDFCETEFLFAHETPALKVRLNDNGAPEYVSFDPLHVLSNTAERNRQYPSMHYMPLLQSNPNSIKYAYLLTLAANNRVEANTMAALWAIESMPRSIKARAELHLTQDYADPLILPSLILANRIAAGDNVVSTNLGDKHIDTYTWFKRRVLLNYGQACATDPTEAFRMFVDYPFLGFLSPDLLDELSDLGPIAIDANNPPKSTIELARNVSKDTNKFLNRYMQLVNYYYGGSYTPVQSAIQMTHTYERDAYPRSINEPIALLVVASKWDINSPEDRSKIARIVNNWSATVHNESYDTFWKNEQRSFDMRMDLQSILDLVADIKQNPDNYLESII